MGFINQLITGGHHLVDNFPNYKPTHLVRGSPSWQCLMTEGIQVWPSSSTTTRTSRFWRCATPAFLEETCGFVWTIQWFMIPSDNHHVTKLYAPFSHTHTSIKVRWRWRWENGKIEHAWTWNHQPSQQLTRWGGAQILFVYKSNYITLFNFI